MSGARIENIRDSGAQRRRLGGYVWLVVSIVAAVALLVFHAPHAWRLLVVLPVSMSAIGLLQAREKT